MHVFGFMSRVIHVGNGPPNFGVHLLIIQNSVVSWVVSNWKKLYNFLTCEDMISSSAKASFSIAVLFCPFNYT